MAYLRFEASFILLASGALALVAGCDGDGTGAGGSGGTSNTTEPTGGTGGATGGTGGAAGGTGGATGGTGGAAGGTGGATGGTGGATGGAGGAVACDMLPDGPLTPTTVIDVFNGSEDIAFDGKGHIAGKDGQQILLADAAGMTTMVAMNVPQAYGLRYRPDGFLVVALPNDDKVIEVSPAGQIADVVTNLNGPNGLYPDFDGNVWMTEIGAGRVSRINPDKTVDVIVSGPQAAGANGVVLDPNRNMLFYTNYGQGRIRSVDLSAAGGFTGVEVVQIQGASLDGLVMDACGHLYVVDQGNSDIYRVKLDAQGAAMGPAEMMASFQSNVANAQFGSGAGFDPNMLYAGGNPGTVYAIAVGVPGAPVPTPP
jgi:sugar lactone lactonase YvrE